MNFPASLLLAVLLLALMSGPTLGQQSAPPRPAVPLDPTAAILDAFRTHSVVALGEGAHGNEQGHAFRLSLIRDPRFTATVNDIVVEVGNSLYQALMDRFVRGEEVPYDALRQVWENTTQAQANWHQPIYEEFVRAVRAVNASLSRDRQLRVLLGDPPIDWDNVSSAQDHSKWMDLRDSYPADLIRLEVMEKKRRALVIYGDMHFQRKQLLSQSLGRHQAAASYGALAARLAASTLDTVRNEAPHPPILSSRPRVAWPVSR